jgi:hypothetical protein
VARLDAKIHGYFYLWERCASLLRTLQLRGIADIHAEALARSISDRKPFSNGIAPLPPG